MEEFICSYCGKVCKNSNSLRNHERLCKHNPNKQISYFSIWNQSDVKHYNQYTKAKELGTQYIMSDETRRKLSEAQLKRTKEFNKQVGRKISQTVQRKVKEGTWHTSVAKRMNYEYRGIRLHGKWELAFAKYLDANNIPWSRPTQQFIYIFEGKQRFYTPDFYLINTDEFVEIKGYKTLKDDAKWTQFPKDKTLLVYRKKELKELGVIK